MTHSRIIFLLLFWGILSSCNRRQEDNTNQDSEILQQFEKAIKESIDGRNNNKVDSISRNLVLDSFYIEDLKAATYRVAFGQYHTDDNILDIGIVGIDDFKSKEIATFLLVDTKPRKYLIDSVKVISDSLHLYCRSFLGSKNEKLVISYDLDFDGKSFPWNVK